MFIEKKKLFSFSLAEISKSYKYLKKIPISEQAIRRENYEVPPEFITNTANINEWGFTLFSWAPL